MSLTKLNRNRGKNDYKAIERDLVVKATSHRLMQRDQPLKGRLRFVKTFEYKIVSFKKKSIFFKI